MQAQKRKKADYIVAGIFLSITGFLFLFLLFSHVKDILLAFESEQWPVTQGNITYSKAKIGCGKGASYYPQVEYQYSVGQIQLTNSRITFGTNLCGSLTEAKKISAQYATGSNVFVHYNLNNPTNSVLVVGHVSVSFYFSALIPLFSIVGIAYLLNKIRYDLNTTN